MARGFVGTRFLVFEIQCDPDNNGPFFHALSFRNMELFRGDGSGNYASLVMSAARANLLEANNGVSNDNSIRTGGITAWAYTTYFEDYLGQRRAKIEDRGRFQLGIAGIPYGGGIVFDNAADQVDDAIETDAAVISVAQNEFFQVHAQCIARKTDGTKFASWDLSAKFYRNTGNVIQQGNTTHHEDETGNEPTWTFRIVPDTGNNTIDLRFKGEASVRYKISFSHKKVT